MKKISEIEVEQLIEKYICGDITDSESNILFSIIDSYPHLNEKFQQMINLFDSLENSKLTELIDNNSKVLPQLVAKRLHSKPRLFSLSSAITKYAVAASIIFGISYSVYHYNDEPNIITQKINNDKLVATIILNEKNQSKDEVNIIPQTKNQSKYKSVKKTNDNIISIDESDLALLESEEIDIVSNSYYSLIINNYDVANQITINPYNSTILQVISEEENNFEFLSEAIENVKIL